MNKTIDRVLVINSHPIDLYLSWSLEYCLHLQKVNKRAKLYLVDISRYAPCNDLPLKSQTRKFLNGFKKNRDFFEYIQKKVEPENFHLIQKGLRLAIGDLKISVIEYIRVLRIGNLYKYTLYNTHEDLIVNSLHSSLSNKYSSVFYNHHLHPIAVFLRILSFQRSKRITEQVIMKFQIDEVIVGNGRFPNSAGTIAAARSQKVNISFLERGGLPGTFDVFSKSPHSTIERREAANTLWKKFDKYESFREICVTNYVESRKNYDIQAGFSWISEHKIDVIESLKKAYPTFKICVFYSSTELEIPAIRDSVDKLKFKNQAQALSELLEILDPQEWIVILRRHPFRKRMWRDPERKLWSQILEQNHKNLVVYNAKSKIDSYSLANDADLVCHWKSTIGAEIILTGSTPVITLGPTFWDVEEVPFVARNREDLKLTISKINEKENQIPISKIEERHIAAQKWAFYWTFAGVPFKHIEWFEGRGAITTSGKVLE